MAAEQAEPPSTGIAGAASVIALGNLTSRVLGLVRESLSASLFGASGLVSAFGIANIIPRQLYDLLIGGMLNSALIPIFAEYAALGRRRELWRVFSLFITLTALALAAVVLLLELLAPQLTWLIAGGFDDAQLAATQRLIRLMLPSMWLLSLSGVVTAALYAQKRYLFPALATAIYNGGIIAAMWLLAPTLGIYSMGVGVVLAGAAQLLIQLPALRGANIRPNLDWRHPALQRVLALYAPVVLGLVITMIQVTIDRRLASGTGASSIAWMDKATTLIQAAHGLVAVAISTAVLPLLSACSAQGNWHGFRHTLGQALRLALLLIVPLAVGMFWLAEPMIQLVFEHGQFGPLDTAATAQALRIYLLGLIFATIDWPLNYGFYARQDTLTPALVGVGSVGVYLIAAFALLPRWGMLGLVLADSCKHVAHALTMLVLTQRRIQGISGQGLLMAVGKIAAASALMLGVVALAGRWNPLSDTAGEAWAILWPTACGGGIYLVAVYLLRLDEVRLLVGALLKRFRRSTKD